MVEFVDVVILLGGAVLLFGGATLSVYGVALLGALVGGAGGFLLAPTVGSILGLEGLVATAAATAIGIIAGVLLSYVLLSVAIAALSFVAGTFAGLVVLGALFPDLSPFLLYPAALLVGGVAAALGSFLSKTVLVLVTSFAGATLLSGSITLADLDAAASQVSLDPILFDVASPIFLGLFVLGILVQFGIFKLGYVTKIAAILPGASVLRNRGEETK
jgi:hypothetical protein